MSTQIDIFIDKLYRYDRRNEHCFIGFPLEKGLVSDTDKVFVRDPANETCINRLFDCYKHFLILTMAIMILFNKHKNVINIDW